MLLCVPSLIVPQGPDLGCYEQMVIIARAQREAAEDRGCCFKSLRSQIDFSNLDGVILFSARQAKVVPFNPQCHPHPLPCEVLLSVVISCLLQMSSAASLNEKVAHIQTDSRRLVSKGLPCCYTTSSSLKTEINTKNYQHHCLSPSTKTVNSTKHSD